ncbi:hypothetical protein JAAARDRAFT_125936 [Jaapia argillacea MUCL 33604]|uniref:PLAC8-domain-containing protein n=1 Tax=Jaapia argillacea MUCL 33604 TaxID=933084 RepID=A0A067Q2M8_9AGAM|nr:hypothetical protein JAAARDRAFT_125936 [Jaapia argillacea MUCL 33604]
MAVGGGGNRNVKNLPFDANGQREWSNGICGCFGDVGTCLISWWCPCLVYSQNKSRVEYLEQNGRPHPDGGDMCGTDCCCYACLLYFGCGWVLQMGNRAAVRTRYRIAGNGATDCLAAACCTPCELVQESQELELEERSLMQ